MPEDASPPPLACPACGAGAAGDAVTHGAYRFYPCSRCGLLYLHPRPAQAELNRLYVRPGEITDYSCKAASRRRRASLRTLRLLPRIWRRDVLDLGCGGGFMAQAMAPFARTCTGIDVDPAAVAWAQAHFPRPHFRCAGFEELLDDAGRYDFIYSAELIEHVADPVLYMRVLARLCRPGAQVFITTPDLGHPRVPRDLERWDVFNPPEHVQFFDRGAATGLLGRHGFAVVRCLPARKPGLRILARYDAPR